MKKYKIGYTQGTFDMFHIGHLNLLHQASVLCDTLIVGVNSDQLVNEYKHKTHVVSERDRAAILDEGRLIIFDRPNEKTWEKRIWHKPCSFQEKTIMV